MSDQHEMTVLVERRGAVGIVTRERLLVRPLVATVAKFLQQRAFGAAERPTEDFIPCFPHQLQ